MKKKPFSLLNDSLLNSLMDHICVHEEIYYCVVNVRDHVENKKKTNIL